MSSVSHVTGSGRIVYPLPTHPGLWESLPPVITFPYFFAIKLLPFKLLIIIQRYAQSEYQVFQSAVLLVYFYHYENNSDVLAEPVKFQSFVRKIKANSRPGHVIMNEK